ncbi:hypothetical protein AGMMS49944_01840 [Spirochaetia bacterium]|nr:hypothetical protein AGMMS49944_01840 [Spirochaetia bacterium]
MKTKPGIPAGSCRLVIIDDHPILREGLVAVLKKQWTIVGQAANIKEARGLFAALTKAPDLVILDIGLKETENGLELLPFLAERYKHARDPGAPAVLVYSIWLCSITLHLLLAHVL